MSTLLTAWAQQVRERPSSPSVHYFGATLTFAQIDDAAARLAAALRARGIYRGDRIAIYLQNDPQWLVALLAAWRIGAVPVAVNPMLRSKEVHHILTNSGARALVCMDALYDPNVRPVHEQTDLVCVITTNPLDMASVADLPANLVDSVAPTTGFADTVAWADALADSSYPDAAPPEPADSETDGSDIAVLTYTSGTTGRAKGAMNTHAGMVHSSTVYSDWWDVTADDVLMCPAPIFHITGLVAGFGLHIVTGAPLVLSHRFDSTQILHDIDRRGGTFMIAASTAYIALCDDPTLPSVNLSTMTKTLSGGAAVSQGLVDRVRAATGWVLHGAYGMTETTSPTHLSPVGVPPPVDPDSGALSVGVPVPGAHVRIVDVDTGEEVPPGDVGEIVVSGPMVVPGYWGLPEETALAIRDGRLHTGDIGKEGPDGWLFVVDRLKDLINAGGYKVYPRDVEDVLYTHPAVREACVVGVPDEYRGETVKAFVSLVGGVLATEDALIAYCREQMAAYKYPRQVTILDELPKNAAGKLLRRELRDA